MPLHTVGPLENLPDQMGSIVRVGPHQIAVFRVGQEVFAIDNECPHAGAALANGYVEGTGVACPWHYWEFDMKTGQCRTVSDMEVETYEVVIENGIVKLALPDRY